MAERRGKSWQICLIVFRVAKQVYKDILHVTDEEILTRTFQNPFGKINGDDTCIISIPPVLSRK